MPKQKEFMKVLWVLLAKSANVDQYSNQLSIFNILEDLAINIDPAGTSNKIVESPQKSQIPFDSNLIVQIEKDLLAHLKDFNPFINIKLVDPRGDVLGQTSVPVKFEEGKQRVRLIISINSLPITTSGSYKYVVETKNSTTDSFIKSGETAFNVKIFG